MENAGIVTFN